MKLSLKKKFAIGSGVTALGLAITAVLLGPHISISNEIVMTPNDAKTCREMQADGIEVTTGVPCTVHLTVRRPYFGFGEPVMLMPRTQRSDGPTN